MGLRSWLRGFARQVERSTADYEREREERRGEQTLVDELRSALIDLGFAVTQDQIFPMSSRLIELARGQLVFLNEQS